MLLFFFFYFGQNDYHHQGRFVLFSIRNEEPKGAFRQKVSVRRPLFRNSGIWGSNKGLRIIRIDD